MKKEKEKEEEEGGEEERKELRAIVMRKSMSERENRVGASGEMERKN
jgi:hypothetical protein